MDLEALRAQARAVATRMETRINTALGANRDLTADEEAAQTADEAELTELKAQIATAERAGNGDDAADPVAAAVTAERARIVALADLCPSSVVATPLRTAIEQGTDAGAFAIGLAQAAKGRGASVADLKKGAVQEDQLPAGSDKVDKTKTKTGAEQATGILALAASAGIKAAAHLRKQS